MSGPGTEPLLRVVRGAPTGPELAAVLTVVLALARARHGADAPLAERLPSGWWPADGTDRPPVGWSADRP
ncbi:acyl-CoA carboxylase subunit epsilon [Streptomyces sp. CA-249302]|uniref:acyl-CoA carboxylase subunit epsilon n=1 Tax=Streptomyces sp. CA-249302 TaxID=3240058 RepID=UPI003D8A839C